MYAVTGAAGFIGSHLVEAMERAPAGAVYNVGGDSEATMRETIELFERIAGRRPNLLVGERMAGDVRRTAPDTARIRAELGWEPRVDLEQGLTAHWKWASERVAPAD